MSEERAMPMLALVITLGAGLCTLVCAAADLQLPTTRIVETPLAAPLLDPTIASAIARISSNRLRAIDTQLVAFGTRSTFSEHAGRKRGVFAARDWIAAQFRAIARRANGRMTVTFDTYWQPQTAKTCRATPRSQA